MAQKLSTSMKAALITIPAVVIIAVVLILISVFNRPEAPAASSVPMVLENSHVVDDAGADAPTLVEFLDFECPSCAAVYPIIEDLRAQYDGKINYVIRYFPLEGHKNSMTSALAVEAAAQQGKFEEMVQKMFESQPEWGMQDGIDASVFRGFAEELGLDMAAFDAAVADPKTQERIEEDLKAGEALGVTGTPTFFLDGKELQLEYVEDLTRALDEAVAARK